MASMLIWARKEVYVPKFCNVDALGVKDLQNHIRMAQSELNKLLSDGWEPYAVTEDQLSKTYYLKRGRKGTADDYS